MSIEPHCTIASLTSASTPASSATSAVRPTPFGNAAAAASAPRRSAIDDPRALGRKAVGDGMADSLRTARDERDLAVELTHVESPFYWSAENGVGVRIRFCCVWMSGWILPMNAFQSSRAISAARRSSRCAKLS